MCGIAGNINFSKKDPKQIKDDLGVIQDSLTHRGPDGDGEFYDGFVGAVMRRLSIIDVKGGDQPFFSENRDIVVIANGEIYNYVELRKYLLERGHSLRSKSDIETIVHLYQEKGINFVEGLRGMFAIFLYDRKLKKAFLIRDRMGEKPIYYTEGHNSITFASEMKSLINLKGLKPKISPRSIDLYFHYYYVPEPDTMFENVKKLPAGSIMQVDLGEKKHFIWKYWEPQELHLSDVSDPAKMIKQKFMEACGLALRSDVPVGVTLSGGMDSSAILAVSRKEFGKAPEAFSVGYSGEIKSDESAYAENFAKKMGVGFNRIEINDSEMTDFFPDLVYNGDDPVADIAAHNIYSVCSEAKRNGVSVLLGGIGGDELFWGYPHENSAVTLSIRKMQLYRNPIFKGVHNFLNPNDRPVMFNKRLKYISMLLAPENQMVFTDINREFISAERYLKSKYSKVFGESLGDANSSFDYLDLPKTKYNQTSLAREIVGRLIETWLISNCNVLNDRLSMAASVEYRSPFLDYKFVDFALGSRKIMSSHGKTSKYWFKRAMKGILPAEILERPKRGFTPPVSRWRPMIISRYNKYLTDGFLANENIIKVDSLKNIQRFWKYQSSHWAEYYQLILLEIWGRRFFYGEK